MMGMNGDELRRTSKALRAVYGWSDGRAMGHVLQLPAEKRARISMALKEWAVDELADEKMEAEIDE